MDDDVARLRIKQLAAEDRPREKMLLKGVVSLSNAELLALLIGSGNVDETAVQLSQRILNNVSNNLHSLGKLSLKELMLYKGIGTAKAITIAAALELGKRRGAVEPAKFDSVKSSIDVFRLFEPLISDLPYEELWIALANSKLMVTKKIRISQGGVTNTIADIRIIMKEAVLTPSYGLVLCHNHTSGSPQPSEQDDILTKKVQMAAELFNIKLGDHIVIADKKYYSYADEGRI